MGNANMKIDNSFITCSYVIYDFPLTTLWALDELLKTNHLVFPAPHTE